MDALEKVAVLSILVNTGLAGLKFVLGTVSGSVAIVADGIHSTSSEHYGEAPYIALFTKHLKTQEIVQQDIINTAAITAIQA